MEMFLPLQFPWLEIRRERDFLKWPTINDLCQLLLQISARYLNLHASPKIRLGGGWVGYLVPCNEFRANWLNNFIFYCTEM